MKCLFCLLAAVSISVSLGACGLSVNVPPAPDVRPALSAYEQPTARVRGEIMAAVASQIEELRDDVANSEIYEEILGVIVDFQAELDEATDEDGNLELEGVLFPSPNGAAEVSFVCEGWDENQTELDPANGAINLTLTLDSGLVGPLVWGEVDMCQFPVVTETDRFNASYDGSIAVFLGDFVSTSQNLYDLPITFFVAGVIAFEGKELEVDESFRVSLRVNETNGEVGLDRLEILVRVPDSLVEVPGTSEAFIYIFDLDTMAQGIRDATGTFGCSLENRNCSTESGTLFSW